MRVCASLLPDEHCSLRAPGITSCSCESVLATSASFAPSLAHLRAMEAPMPRPPPGSTTRRRNYTIHPAGHCSGQTADAGLIDGCGKCEHITKNISEGLKASEQMKIIIEKRSKDLQPMDCCMHWCLRAAAHKQPIRARDGPQAAQRSCSTCNHHQLVGKHACHLHAGQSQISRRPPWPHEAGAHTRALEGHMRCACDPSVEMWSFSYVNRMLDKMTGLAVIGRPAVARLLQREDCTTRTALARTEERMGAATLLVSI